MANIKMVKKQIREEFLLKRQDMTENEVKLKSKLICKQVIESNEYKQAKLIFCYYPLGNEVDILAIVHQAFKDKKKVCFPKVINKLTMKFYEVTTLDEFQKGRFDVMEPTSTCEVSVYDQALMLVPGLSFDSKNHRIGYGAGYYDRYINNALKENTDFFTCGVFYSWQKKDILPIDAYDESLTCIVTESSKEIIESNK